MVGGWYEVARVAEAEQTGVELGWADAAWGWWWMVLGLAGGCLFVAMIWAAASMAFVCCATSMDCGSESRQCAGVIKCCAAERADANAFK